MNKKETITIVLLLVWLGIVLGVSFIATPIKFQAPHLTMPIAVEVGKVTFHLLNKIEWALLILLLVLMRFIAIDRKLWICISLLALTLISQTFWLLPILDLRVDRVILGETLSSGYFHLIYIFVEILKLILLGITAIRFKRKSGCS